MMPARSLTSLTVPQHTVQAIATVIRASEEVFTSAGDALAKALDQLTDTRDGLSRLNGLLDAGASARLLAGVAQAEVLGTGIAQAADSYLAACTKQRQSVRAVRIEVDDLDRVVRTISNVSVNARIQAGALSPPRPQVAAFIQRLASMSAEAEDVLAGVRLASAAIEDDMMRIDTQTKELGALLTYDLLPALARFASLGRMVHDRQGQMAAANDIMADRTRQIAEQVSRLVIALQTGDSTRQRLERVAEVLNAEPDPSPKVESAVLTLARRLFDAAQTAALKDCATATESAIGIKDAAIDALRHAPTAFLPLADTSRDAELERRLDDFTARLDRLAEGSVQISARLTTILQSESRLRQVSHQVRLSGLNAVLVCAKLGHEGRALRELAQWLRALTDESDGITARLQQALGGARDDLALTGTGRIAEIGTHLDGFRACAAALQDQATQIETCRAETASGCVAVADQLDRLLGSALMGLRRFSQDMGSLSAPMLLLSLRQAGLPPPDGTDAETVALFDRLRQGYTMQAERDLHDTVLHASAASGLPASNEVIAETDAETDDVFF